MDTDSTPTTPAPEGANAAAVPIPEQKPPETQESELERIERLRLNADQAPHSGDMSSDIASILKDVGLPERSDLKQSPTEPMPQATPAETPSVQPQKPEGRPIVVPLHTLKDDMQDVVRSRKLSLVRMAALQEDKKRPAVSETRPRPSKKTAFILFLSALLFALGIGALYGVALVQKSRPAAQARSDAILFSESQSVLAIGSTTPSEIKAEILRAPSSAAPGSITRIIPTVSAESGDGQGVRPATTGEFLEALGTQAPDELIRGLGTSFFFGLHVTTTDAPVFVIPVTSYEHAFHGMLAWEATMDADLSPLVESVPALISDSNGLPQSRTFSDTVIQNYDVRVLKDDSGQIILYYSFPKQNLLIIATDPYTFPEVLSRLQAQRQL